ncbi:MAG: biopolymer transporter ExbD [Desulfosarcinaceae bacterium]|nr:biopolymer transporter ExbD [Desulfosarcinaceae bacterium]
MRIRRPTSPQARIEILPLIDIVFLLLVFFIYAMLSMAVHRGMPVDLPASSAAEIDKQLTLSVTVQADGGLFLDKSPVSLAALQERITRQAMQEGKPAAAMGVLLFADRSVTYQQIFEVLDQIRLAGPTRISLQAVSPENGGQP